MFLGTPYSIRDQVRMVRQGLTSILDTRGPQGPRARLSPDIAPRLGLGAVKPGPGVMIGSAVCHRGVHVHHELSHLGPGALRGPGRDSPLISLLP